MTLEVDMPVGKKDYNYRLTRLTPNQYLALKTQ